ncbi:uncharacterized protein BDZ99DRAFT_512635 [Mytilinidion resinicola]|uniref:Alpha-ketoglutarate-dependent sulfonate dioxygenase n=1 Tax=Mytilinidion resinicola TaxID=574789 RepID=A0A6A6Y0Y3_9PEZI|nr:uncharacterized protein BDZ99DRAFT_512635 [Mytilinidion resinicola]KAF2802183.1 hypothetical protein BDZ99DRAFT_512635 [Mytilinidion resinicola]
MSSSHLKSLSIGSETSSKSGSRTEPSPPPPPPPPADPPAYSDTTGSSDFQFETLDFTLSPLGIPTSSECVAHLRLLNAFHRLRYEVGNFEGVFGINDPGATDGPDRTRNAEWLKEKRWAIYVTRAADRFEKWWGSLPKTSGEKNAGEYDTSEPHGKPTLKTTDFEFVVETSPSTQNPRTFPVSRQPLGIGEKLPPLDILMVWHAYMLNPRVYLEDCMRLSRQDLYTTPFPWEQVHKRINGDTFVFTVPAIQKINFEKDTGITWDNIDGPNEKEIACPNCSTTLHVPWTQPPAELLLNDQSFKTFMSHDSGFAGNGFSETCHSCHLTVTHEKLRVAKFIDDCNALLSQKRPMPGTILGLDGTPELVEEKKKLGNHDLFFPNRIVEQLPDFRFSFKADPELTMENVKSRIESIMANSSEISVVNADQSKPDFISKKSKNAIRRMMAQYWDNSSRFGIDLIGAVIRQGTFVQKMYKIDWYHSPAIIATMDRSILKYHRFIGLIKDNPKRTAVPTLDVDLAWHTHQLNPRTYYIYTVYETKKFVNHDDKIPEGDLSTFFKWTCNAYERKYGKPYSECSCWYCESTRESQRLSIVSKLNPLARARLWEVGIYRTRQPTDVVNGPHISTHNAIKWSADGFEQRPKLLHDNDKGYAKVCKAAQKKGTEPPNRDEGEYVYSPYGMPMYVEYYGPYVADPTVGEGAYCTDPTQAENRPGGGGGCVAGTCGGTISLGSCAGDAGPACASACGGHGDAAGGCGSCGGGCGGGGD